MKNKCDTICKKFKIKYLKRSSEKGVPSSKQFWNFVKALLINWMNNDFISIKNGDAFKNKKVKY